MDAVHAAVHDARLHSGYAFLKELVIEMTAGSASDRPSPMAVRDIDGRHWFQL
jgi:hypothetical protein